MPLLCNGSVYLCVYCLSSDGPVYVGGFVLFGRGGLGFAGIRASAAQGYPRCIGGLTLQSTRAARFALKHPGAHQKRSPRAPPPPTLPGPGFPPTPGCTQIFPHTWFFFRDLELGQPFIRGCLVVP